MAQQWVERVQTRGELTVFAGGGFTGGMWATVLKDAITTFNDLMQAKKFYLDLALTNDPPTEKGGADVKVEAVATQVSFSYAGTSYSKPFDGNGLHGKTLPVSLNDQIEKAFVFVPQTPRVSNKRGAREVGSEVRRFILVHEFIHAAGLGNDEHTLTDVFCYPGELTEGQQPADDRLHPWGSPNLVMPPYILGDKTMQRLKSVWPYSYR